MGTNKGKDKEEKTMPPFITTQQLLGGIVVCLGTCDPSPRVRMAPAMS